MSTERSLHGDKATTDLNETIIIIPGRGAQTHLNACQYDTSDACQNAIYEHTKMSGSIHFTHICIRLDKMYSFI